ncbi:MAG: VWA containing CoxE family protein, partial [Lachnospiraceae bacterium]|nr:VWA containing CoxE family protein [Lachnospiraceae bacterium]
MFIDFFYTLKAKGLDISMTEWLTLMEALDKGLIGSDFSNFYYISRMILVKSESDYDKFDLAFMEFFHDIQSENALPDALKEWLDKGEDMEFDKQNQEMYSFYQQRNADEVKRLFRERLTEQNSEHNGGNHWIGTAGGSAFGHHGRNVGGIRVGEQGGMQSAFQVLGERKYQDFRNDRVLNMRQYQVAFRRLRQYSSRLDVPKTELDIDNTIRKTCDNGGYLQLEFDRPRKNTVKLLLLFDCGGTMIPFMELCNELFQAVHKANHFKDVKTYYFHNCIYSKVYK